MSREKDVYEKRRDDVEERIMRLLRGQVTTDEMGQIFDDARRYRALYRFVDDTDLGTITAGAVYPHLAESDDVDADAPPAPEHLKAEGGDLVAVYGRGLDALADFLDYNRNAGKLDDDDDPYGQRQRALSKSELRSAKARESDA